MGLNYTVISSLSCRAVIVESALPEGRQVPQSIMMKGALDYEYIRVVGINVGMVLDSSDFYICAQNDRADLVEG